MKTITNDEKRELLAELLSGNVDALRVYQAQTTLKDLDGRIVIDSREVGGPIELVERGGIKTEITPEEYERFPVTGRVIIIDARGNHPVREPDEDYNFFDDKLNP